MPTNVSEEIAAPIFTAETLFYNEDQAAAVFHTSSYSGIQYFL
jgi:hypothetical protein